MAHIVSDPADVPAKPFHVRINGEFWDPVTTIMLKHRYGSQSQVVNLLVAEAIDARNAMKAEQQKTAAIKTTPKAQRDTVRQNAKLEPRPRS